MRLSLRLNELGDDWQGVLVRIDQRHSDSPILVLRRRRAGADAGLQHWDRIQQNYLSFPDSRGDCYVLEAELTIEHADPKRKLVRVGFPLSLLEGAGEYDVAVSWNAGALRLHVDGALVDQEWPAGHLREPVGEVRVYASQVRDVQLTDQTLPAADVSPTGRVHLPSSHPDRLQYWTPSGHNAWMGDTMCFSHDGRFHMFYLLDRRRGNSRFGAGAHQIAHASTTDLVHWEHHPLAVAIEDDETWLTCGTGMPVFHDGRIWLFYGLHTDRVVPYESTVLPQVRDAWNRTGQCPPIPFGTDGKLPMGTTFATSTDGSRFVKSHVIVHGSQNPAVAKDPEGTGFYLLAGYGFDGCYVSEDLLNWRLHDTFLIPHGRLAPKQNTTECQCLFTWNGWHYLLAGRSGMWMSRSPLGPFWDRTTEHGRALMGQLSEQAREHKWHHERVRDAAPEGAIHRPRWDIYDGLWVPTVAPFGDDRRILAGWLSGPGGDYAGFLVFRELVQHDDGTLGTKWPAEMVPPTEAPVRLQAESRRHAVGEAATSISVTGAEETGWVRLSGMPASASVSVVVLPAPGARGFGICIAGDVDPSDVYSGGCELQFLPHLRQVQWSTPAGGAPAAPLPTLDQSLDVEPWQPIWAHAGEHLHFKGGDFPIENVEAIDRPFQLELIVHRDLKSNCTIVDACIDGRRTLITRRSGMVASRLLLFSQTQTVEFTSLTVRPIRPVSHNGGSSHA